MEEIRLSDELYGDFVISEAVILDLLKHPALLRLKGVQQLGLPDIWYPGVKGFTRYNHSIGVFLLLRKLGAPLAEQVAGLLHDVSHTVFSHVIDRIYKTNDSYQDMIHEQYLLLSGLAPVLASHGFDYKEIARYSSFPLLEQESPDICADRVDYTLRELLQNNKEEIALRCVPELASFSRKMVFKDKETVQLFAHNYLERSMNVWTNPYNAQLYALLAEALSIALRSRIISKKDLFSTDQAVIQKLRAAEREDIQRLIARLDVGDVLDGFSSDMAQAKFRYVDPQFLDGLQLKRLSYVDPAFATLLEDCRDRFQKAYMLRTR